MKRTPRLMMRIPAICVGLVLLVFHDGVHADLQILLEQETHEELAAAALAKGDARRGAIVFFQPYLACSKCHVPGENPGQLGPDLTQLPKTVTNTHLVESVLKPSQVIHRDFVASKVLTTDGLTITGLVVEKTSKGIVLRDASRDGKRLSIPARQIEVAEELKQSIMPPAQVNSLASRQQFLDLIRYLIALRDGGRAKARELQPPPALYATRPLPEYETRVDHAGMIRDASPASLRRGKEIYLRVCANCHGTHERIGSLPTSLKFAKDKFKNGSDPYTMYQTMTRGFGLMVPQSWMVPQQKYDVIHYIRNAYLKSHNPTQYFEVNEAYLQALPKGNTRGPAPPRWSDWQRMDYGPNQAMTLEVGRDGKNFAYKGHAIRLDHGQGGVARGQAWMVFDSDTMRMAAAWTGKEFIDWNSIHFNGRHGVHPRLVGELVFQNPSGPGWEDPGSRSWNERRIVGRDQRHYGPLPEKWASFRGLYYHGHDTILAYRVAETDVLERPGLRNWGENAVFLREFEIAPHANELVLQVARLPEHQRIPHPLRPRSVIYGQVGKQQATHPRPSAEPATSGFDGQTGMEIAGIDQLNLATADYTVLTQLQTRTDGPIFAHAASGSRWSPNGKTLFVRSGRLTFDIGWVGAVTGQQRIDDGKLHRVAVTWSHQTGEVRLYVDGKLDGSGILSPKATMPNRVVRLGYTSENFPLDGRRFHGEINTVTFLQQRLSDEQIARWNQQGGELPNDLKVAAVWDVAKLLKTARETEASAAPKKEERKEIVKILRGKSATSPKKQNAMPQHLWACVRATDAGSIASAQFKLNETGDLRLSIPPSAKPQLFTLALAGIPDQETAKKLDADFVLPDQSRSLTTLTRGGPRRWPVELTTTVQPGRDDGPFAVDVLTRPAQNPWHCRMRFTGLDFYPDGNRMAVSTWDGSVFLVSGLKQLTATGANSPEPVLKWQRMASGLFQPLGVKILDNTVHVTCRDALYRLHDLNDDGEADFLECFNNDHQVTEHFHEFAMGLQTDEAGNFYYAKSARHAKTAVVPHHGTLLKVSPDGRQTEIVANGFRAANGVCINPDGTFIVTDQEGHWNPKNRINWVQPGGFYGNMFGYHDVTDSSDNAMEQPLCWITNSFDRSPAELLWVTSDRWGPLKGSLLNFSYGYGKVYIVPHEKVGEQMQGGMCELPLAPFPTGIMRGRFRPQDGQLYCCGMFAWAGSANQPGGLYRIRYTGQPVHVPLEIEARPDMLRLKLSSKVTPESAADRNNYQVRVWSLKRTANYGSRHYNEQQLNIRDAKLAADGKTVELEIPKLDRTWCMEIRYSLQSTEGKPVSGVIHNTIHLLGKD